MTFAKLRLAIAGQYVAFSSPQPTEVEGCECCTTPDALCALVAQTRESLPASALEFYARKAVSTVGSETDLRYFWPRLAELSVANALTTDLEIVMGKPLYADHTRWPASEREALLNFATALGSRLAAEELEAGETDAWVCAIGLLAEGLAAPEDMLAPLLADTPAAWRNLQDFIRWNEPSIRKKGRLENAFWENAPQAAARVLTWATTEPRTLEARRELAAESARLYGTVPPAF